MKVENIPTIDLDEAAIEMGLHFSHFEIAQMAENGSYHLLGTDDAAVEELKDDILWEEGKSISRRNRLINQLALVHKLREMGYTNNVRVFIFW